MAVLGGEATVGVPSSTKCGRRGVPIEMGSECASITTEKEMAAIGGHLEDDAAVNGKMVFDTGGVVISPAAIILRAVMTATPRRSAT
jgi:hypothetical protein